MLNTDFPINYVKHYFRYKYFEKIIKDLTLFIYIRMDQSLTDLTCYLLREVFDSSSLDSKVEMSSIVAAPITRYSSCAARKVRDCGVIFYLQDIPLSF